MWIVKDLIGGNKPEPISILYNGTENADSVTKRYAGSFVKRMDIDQVSNGWFFTWGGATTTAMENTIGVLAEDQPNTGNYLPNSTTYGMVSRLVYPIFPSTVIRAEYVQFDEDGTTQMSDTGATADAASTSFTPSAITTADLFIGGWIYMLNGSAAGELHYCSDAAASGAVTFTTATTNAIVAADDFLVIWPVSSCFVRWSTNRTALRSEIDDNACVKHVVILENYIRAPGIPLQPLRRDLHDGLVVSGAKLYSDFIFCGATDAASTLVTNMFIRGETAA